MVQQDTNTSPQNPEPADAELRRVNASLERESEELARALALVRATLESTTDAILVTDSDGNVTGWNARYIGMWYLTPEAMHGTQHRQFLLAIRPMFREPQKVLDRIEEIYANSPTDSYDLLQLTDDRTIERFSRIQFVDQRNVGRVWSFRDITERIRSDETRLRLASIVESSDDAIVSKTLEGVITTWNKGAERMFGYTATEVIGQPVTILIPPDRPDEEPAIIERLKRGERVDHYETVRMRKDGSLLDVSLTVSPIRDATGRVVGASKIARDITERRRAADEREQLLDAERAARAEIERASLLKDEFLATISHELRTPLNAILGWSHLLASGERSPQDLQQGLETIARNARVQAQLIEDLLDMSRIVSGKVRLDVQLTDLGMVVEQAVNTVQPSAEAKGIHLRKAADRQMPQVAGDPNRLQQVAWNLLSNAVKFTPRGGTIDVLVQRANSHLELTVSDTGMGIKPGFLPHVFERFRQADASAARIHGGLGLGLAIVKQLVELHGGTVRAYSDGEGKGATFMVTLPVAPVRPGEKRADAPTPVAAALDTAAVDLAGVRVLVVEDEPDARDLIKRVLTQCHAEVLTAADAAEALALLQSEVPHVLVSDIGMPRTDGYQFIRQVRRLPASAAGRIPAIALTALARSEDRTRAMLAGYQMHIAKPIEPQELIATVASLAGRMATDDT